MQRLVKDDQILKWALGRSCSLPLTLNHLQYHIHDVLVTGSSALRAEDAIQKEALAARTNHSLNPGLPLSWLLASFSNLGHVSYRFS